MTQNVDGDQYNYEMTSNLIFLVVGWKMLSNTVLIQILCFEAQYLKISRVLPMVVIKHYQDHSPGNLFVKKYIIKF